MSQVNSCELKSYVLSTTIERSSNTFIITDIISCQTSRQSYRQITPTCFALGPGDPLPMTTVLAISIPIALLAIILLIGLTVLILVLRKRKKRRQQADTAKQVYVPVFQEIIEWKRKVESASVCNLPHIETSVNNDERKQCAQSREW